jgi:hypothetical protein
MRGVAGTLTVIAAASVCVVATGCSSSGEGSSNLNGTKGKSIEVSEATWHEGKWPFTVSHGILGCHVPPFPGAVTFNVEGTTYAVNGDAENVAQGEHYENINPIWRSAGGELKVDIDGMIERGLKLCEESE